MGWFIFILFVNKQKNILFRVQATIDVLRYFSNCSTSHNWILGKLCTLQEKHDKNRVTHSNMEYNILDNISTGYGYGDFAGRHFRDGYLHYTGF